MKKRYLGGVILLLGIITFAFYNNEINPVITSNKKTNKFSTSILSINLETAAGSGIYDEATNSLWPSEGYTFNAELSKCENGSELSWDEENKKVLVTSNKSDKCYVYFDKEIIYLNNYIKSLYTIQGENNIYHHDGTLENGINDGSYRYAGSYETTNNWVCFGTDSSECDDEHLYRIIGVFDEKIIGADGNVTNESEERVKLIKAYEGTEVSLGTAPYVSIDPDETYYKGNLSKIPLYLFDDKNINNWNSSKINTEILNGTYLTTLGSMWSSKIAISEWKVGGNSSANVYNAIPAIVYKSEILNPETDSNGNTTSNVKVGLMYASDYGFAATSINWATKINAYRNDTNRNNNWLFLGICEWTITRHSDTSTSIFDVYPDGHLNWNSVGASGVTARPTFYLNSDVTFTGGTGTETDPYRIA